MRNNSKVMVLERKNELFKRTAFHSIFRKEMNVKQCPSLKHAHTCT